MTYARLDDQLDGHPKVRKAGLEAFGVWALAIIHCSRHLTDGHIDAGWLEEKVPQPRRRKQLVARLMELNMLEPNGDGGYVVHDYLDFNPSREEVLKKRGTWNRKKALHRDRGLIEAVRARDGSACRYCATVVDWADRKGPAGGTYDHVDPAGENTLENVVVACRRCNSDKGARTPDQAGIDLIPIRPRPNPGLTQSQDRV